MTEKQGNTKQSNLDYIPIVIHIKKKQKAKSRTSRKLRIGAIFKEGKSRTKNCATRENDHRHPKPFLVIVNNTYSFNLSLAFTSLPNQAVGKHSQKSSLKLTQTSLHDTLSRAPVQLENGITLLPKTAIHTLYYPVLLDIMGGVVAG